MTGKKTKKFTGAGVWLTKTLLISGSVVGMKSLLAGVHENLSVAGYIKDVGMQLSEAYFFGMEEEQRIAFAKQMNVLSACMPGVI